MSSRKNKRGMRGAFVRRRPAFWNAHVSPSRTQWKTRRLILQRVAFCGRWGQRMCIHSAVEQDNMSI